MKYLNFLRGLVVLACTFSVNVMAAEISLNCVNRETHDDRGSLVLAEAQSFMNIDSEVLTVKGEQQIGELILRNESGNRRATMSLGEVNAVANQMMTSVVVMYGEEELLCRMN